MEVADHSLADDGDSEIWKSWSNMTPLEKFLTCLSVLFSIVIYSMMLVLIARDYRLESWSTECTFSTKTWDIYAPLVLTRDARSFIYPHNGTITMSSGSSLLLACPGTTFKGIKTKKDQVEVSCYNGRHTALRRYVQPHNISCATTFNSTARFAGRLCFKNTNEVEIGFEVNATTFVRQMRVCFNADEMEPIFTEYNVSKDIAGRFPKASTHFKAEKFFQGFDLEKLYLGQEAVINEITGFDVMSTQNLNRSNGTILTEGQLAPADDFVYSYQQNATYYYINVSPQWENIHLGNWRTIEEDTRKLAGSLGTDLLVITGTYGVATLRDKRGRPTEIFMIPQSAELLTMSEFPVPKYFWKVVYSARDKRGVALVTINTPYVTQDEFMGHLICRDLTHQVGWLSWESGNTTQGVSYACDINDLRRSVTHIPPLEVHALLT